jgi:hypothetical protein
VAGTGVHAPTLCRTTYVPVRTDREDARLHTRCFPPKKEANQWLSPWGFTDGDPHTWQRHLKALAQHVRHPLKFNDEVHKQRYGDLEVIHYVVLHVVRRIRDKTLATVFEDEDLQTGQREA